MNENTTQRDKVLIVDDNRENVAVLSQSLAPEGYDIRVALNGTVALELTRNFLPDLILLDVMMPDLDGFEVCRQLKADPSTEDIPVIFITAKDETKDVIAGFEAGGVDYILKPFKEAELKKRASTHLNLRRAMVQIVQQKEALEEEIAQRKVVTEQRDQLTDRLSLISDEEAKRWGVDGFIGKSETLRKIMTDIERLQQVDSTSVLITGESGTGKELVARALHFGSVRAEGPFMPLNCSAISHELADSLIFGHVKGAFTGADRDRVGYFALADGGTLFLDEVGDMPLALQAKLLRVLEERSVLPVGGEKERSVDVRVVAATNADLEEKIGRGEFRQDLYFRLAGFPVQVPPLRDRREDIPMLVEHFVGLFAGEMGIQVPEIADSALSDLGNYAFPGNIRELKNVIERALIESGGKEIDSEHLHLSAVKVVSSPTRAVSVDDLPLNMEEAERALIKRAMAQANGNVAKAARLLGINRMRIHRRLAADEE